METSKNLAQYLDHQIFATNAHKHIQSLGAVTRRRLRLGQHGEAVTEHEAKAELFFCDVMRIVKSYLKIDIIAVDDTFLSISQIRHLKTTATVINSVGQFIMLLSVTSRDDGNGNSDEYEYAIVTDEKLKISLKQRGATHELRSNNAKRLVKKFSSLFETKILVHPVVKMDMPQTYNPVQKTDSIFYSFPRVLAEAFETIPYYDVDKALTKTLPRIVLNRLGMVVRGELTINQLDAEELKHLSGLSTDPLTEFAVKRHDAQKAAEDAVLKGPKWVVTRTRRSRVDNDASSVEFIYRIDEINFSVRHSCDASLPEISVDATSYSYGLFRSIEDFVDKYPEQGRDLAISLKNAQIVLEDPCLSEQLNNEHLALRDEMYALGFGFTKCRPEYKLWDGVDNPYVERFGLKPLDLTIPAYSNNVVVQRAGVMCVSVGNLYSDPHAVSFGASTMMIVDRFYRNN